MVIQDKKTVLQDDELPVSVVVGAFAKLRKAAISFVMSVRPPAWNNWAPNELIFTKFGI